MRICTSNRERPMALGPVRFLLLVVVVLLVPAPAALGQEFVPYPNDHITAAEWKSYFNLVATNHAATRFEIPDQHLVTFNDPATGTAYAFTKPGHPAHPAWIARRPFEQDGW